MIEVFRASAMVSLSVADQACVGSRPGRGKGTQVAVGGKLESMTTSTLVVTQGGARPKR